MKNLRSAALTSTDFQGMAQDWQSHPMYNPGAKEAPAHSQSTNNPMEELITKAPAAGKLGGTGQAGN